MPGPPVAAGLGGQRLSTSPRSSLPMTPSPLSRRRLCAAAFAAAGLLPGWPATALAAEAALALTPAQVQALGVQTQRLAAPAPQPGQAFPARVVLPPAQVAVVAAPLAGSIERLLVAENDTVRAGQPLLRLVSPELGELQLRLVEAASRARLSQQALARERALLAEGIVPERRVQEAEANAAADRARQAQAEAALRLAGVDGATLRRVAEGGPMLDGLTLTARSAGVVGTLTARPGQRVQAAEPLLQLTDQRRLWLDVEVPAARQQAVPATGLAVTGVDRTLDARGRAWAGSVSASQTVTLRAEVLRSDGTLRPGEALQVRLALPSGGGAPAAGAAGASAPGFTVPVAAVARQDDQAVVFVRTGQGFAAVPVTVQAASGGSVQVSGALRAGQEIAVSSVVALKAAWLGKGGSN